MCLTMCEYGMLLLLGLPLSCAGPFVAQKLLQWPGF